MKEYNLGQTVTAKGFGIFNIIKKHPVFSGFVEERDPMMLVFDENSNMERYILKSEYDRMGYDVVKDLTIIIKGFFMKEIFLTEEKPRYDIRNIETDEVIKHCYLHNGNWLLV